VFRLPANPADDPDPTALLRRAPNLQPGLPRLFDDLLKLCRIRVGLGNGKVRFRNQRTARTVTQDGDRSHPNSAPIVLRLSLWARVNLFMRDAQKKILERIETIVTAYNGAGAGLELLVNHSRENSGHIYVQPIGNFQNIIECGFIFESRFAVFDFGQLELQVEYAKPETVLRVLDAFRSAVAAYVREHGRRPVNRMRVPVAGKANYPHT